MLGVDRRPPHADRRFHFRRDRVLYDRTGSGPPLVLVHGAFSDHVTNWEFVLPLLEQQFTVYAVARRGRTSATTDHTLEDEAADVAAVVRAVGEPVFLLGHSYGAQTALAAAAQVPDRVRKLVLYEAPRPDVAGPDVLPRLEALGQARDWDGLAAAFFRDALAGPAEEVEGLRATSLWPTIVADAAATCGRSPGTTSGPNGLGAYRCRWPCKWAAKARDTCTSPRRWRQPCRTCGSTSCPARRTRA